MTQIAFAVSRNFLSSFTALIERLVSDYKEERRVRAERARIVAELDASTDRELAELGFSRADLPAIARGTYRR